MDALTKSGMVDIYGAIVAMNREVELRREETARLERMMGAKMIIVQTSAIEFSSPGEWACPNCGPVRFTDEDGCCLSCGADCNPDAPTQEEGSDTAEGDVAGCVRCKNDRGLLLTSVSGNIRWCLHCRRAWAAMTREERIGDWRGSDSVELDLDAYLDLTWDDQDQPPSKD